MLLKEKKSDKCRYIRLIVLFLSLLFLSIYVIIHEYILIYDYLQCFQFMAFSSYDLYIPKIYFRLLMQSGYYFFLTVQKICIELKKTIVLAKIALTFFFYNFFYKVCVHNYINLSCILECQLGYYGINCNRCSTNCNVSGSCDRLSGHCHGGCQRGWIGYFCNQGKSVLYHLYTRVVRNVRGQSNLRKIYCVLSRMTYVLLIICIN